MAEQAVELTEGSIEKAHRDARWIVMADRGIRQFNERYAEIADRIAAYQRRYEDEVNAEMARLRAAEEEQ